MQQPTYDPGLTLQVTGRLRRVINKDGSFNVRRRGTTWRDWHVYLQLINMRWPRFVLVILSGYVAANLLFASAYYLLGPGHLTGAEGPGELDRFLTAFYFSAHTLTTVGYGNVSPVGHAANLLSIVEALVGLLAFAVGTGVFYGRVSRPSARIGFSEHAIIAPYQQGTSVQFRIVNLRDNVLMELEARIMLMTVVQREGQLKREYANLTLERDRVLFLPLTWTLVHPIDSESPLFGKTPADLETLQAELIILIKGYDDTFSQTVHTRHSYRYDEFVWRERFAPAFHIDKHGDMVLDVDRVGEHVAAGA
ncbi:MAG TPA: ion channel [Bryobacteraceae bacterium]|nr:ion channel [Bryobacteraceae bacterium]